MFVSQAKNQSERARLVQVVGRRSVAHFSNRHQKTPKKEMMLNALAARAQVECTIGFVPVVVKLQGSIYQKTNHMGGEVSGYYLEVPQVL